MTKDSEDQLVSLLGKVPLFSNLKPKQLKAIAGGGKDLFYTPGQHIVEEGSEGVGFYLILDGQVRVRKGKKTLAELKAGDFFGEMSLFDSQPRSATVEAVTATKCLGISSWTFMGLVKGDPDIAVNLMKELATRLRLSNRALAE